MPGWTSLCGMHRSQSHRFGQRIALRYPQDGLYHDLPWSDYRRQADQAAAGLIRLGIHTGDRVAILSENRFEWFIADHAVLSCGAVDVPLHAPLAPAQVAYQIGHSGAKGVIVSSQCQLDKVLAVLGDLPDLEFLIAFDSVTPAATRLKTLSWQELKHSGRAVDRDQIAAREAGLKPDSLATIIYTSGTTGHPKGVMLSHRNLLTNAASTGEISYLSSDDVLMSWLPYSHIYARTVDHYLTSICGITVALARCVDTLMADIQQVQPTWLTAVPRVYEKVWNGIAGLDPETRARAVRRIFGDRMKQLTSGGAPLPRHIAEGIFATGLPLLEGYGLTESSPVIAFNNIHQYRLGSVGKAIRDVEVRIADDGEILTRGPHVMQGYWRNPEATAATINDGWLLTGDVGRLDDDGFLFITDRKKDLFVTSAGKNIAPAELERLLTQDAFIDQAVVYGDGRQFVSALIVPSLEALRVTSEQHGDPSQTDGDFLTSPVLQRLLQERIDLRMEQVSQPERVKKFLILARPFQLADDELTATLKVRRRFIISKYEAALAALYDE